MVNSKSKPSLFHNKLLPFKSVWHTVGVWIPDRNRHDGLWCNSPDKTSTEQCVSSQFSSCPRFTRLSLPLSFCPHGIPSGQQKTRRACCAILRLYFSIRRWRLTCCFPGEKKFFSERKFYVGRKSSEPRSSEECTDCTSKTWAPAHTCTAAHTKAPVLHPLSPFLHFLHRPTVCVMPRSLLR